QVAAVRVPAFPFPLGPDGTWGQTVLHSKKIDMALAKAGGAHMDQLVATVGKSWILDNSLLDEHGKPKMITRKDGSKIEAACNYGWHSDSAPHLQASGTA